MAKKILKGAGKLIGGKKKAAAPEPAAAPSGPVITQLGSPAVDPALDPRRRIRRRSGTIDPTILADKLGAY